MAIAQSVPLSAFRSDPLHLVISIIGVDLAGIAVTMALRKYPDEPGPALLTLQSQAAAGARGIRLIGVDIDADGIPTSTIEVIEQKAAMRLLPAAAERGANVTVFYDLQVAALPIAGGASAVETTLMFGPLIIKGSCND